MALIQSYSSYYKLLRVFATVLATFKIWRLKHPKPLTVTTEDMSSAHHVLIRIVQKAEFAVELHRLQNDKGPGSRSRLRSHAQFIDDDGLLRSKSRLQNARVSFSRKCPIILPAKSHFTKILIEFIHVRYFHANRPFIIAHLSNFIQWRFNLPHTPHRGAIWEAAVKSAKRFLPIVTKGRVLTFDELATFLARVECILNSRPLIYLGGNDAAEEVLTPGHFLIGKNLTSLPEPLDSHEIRLSDQYKANRARIVAFWKLWHVDYLNQLRSRSKLTSKQQNLQNRQIVILKDFSSAPNDWKLYKITECFPDGAGVVRTIQIEANGLSKVVPVIHIIPLPNAEDQ